MNSTLLSVFPFFSTMIQVAILVPKNRLLGNWMMQSMKLLSTRYLRIFCSAPPRYIMPGKQTIAAVPLEASHASECMIKARSALLFGASTPAGAKRGSLMSSGFSSPAHLMEYGGFDTMSSKGSSSQCCGLVRVSSQAMSNLSNSMSCRNILIRHRLYVVMLISCPKKPLRTASRPSTFSAFSSSEPEPQAGSYTLLISFLPTVPSRVSSSETSAGVKNSPPDLPALLAYMVIRYS